MQVVSYFMGLVPNSSKGVVKLKDQVTDSEKWFMTSEIEGSPAVKLDLSLTKPIILMPRRTDSPEYVYHCRQFIFIFYFCTLWYIHVIFLIFFGSYLKLDVVHITVQNTFEWLSGSKNELNAVHLEILTILVRITSCLQQPY